MHHPRPRRPIPQLRSLRLNPVLTTANAYIRSQPFSLPNIPQYYHPFHSNVFALTLQQNNASHVAHHQKNLRLMKYLFTLLNATLFITPLLAQDLSNFTLSCHYPLTNGPYDSAGHCDTLLYKNVHFSDSGAYLNGIYDDGTDPNASNLYSDVIEALQQPTFAVELEFLPVLDSQNRALIVLGPLWRYIKVHIGNDRSIGTSVNDRHTTFHNITLDSGQWHRLVIIHTADDSTTSFYLNGSRIAQYREALNAPLDDRKLTASDGGFGWTYKGWWRHLKIYREKSSRTRLHTTPTTPIIYPNPLTSGGICTITPNIHFDKLTFVHPSGHSYYPTRLHANQYRLSGIPPGLYIALLSTPKGLQSIPIVVLPTTSR